MKSVRMPLKWLILGIVLCLPLVLLNSCQTSDHDIVFSSEVLLNKDSKIVSLMTAAVSSPTNNVSTKSSEGDSKCTQFVYPIIFYAYSSDRNTPEAVVINSDEELLDFFTTLTSDNQFFITYPITLLDVEGNETRISDYPDLEGILTMLVDACNLDTDSNSDGNDGDTSPADTNIVYEYCGNGNNPNSKVVICHNGNSICISVNAIWGHMENHNDDYYGSCNNL